MPRSSTSARPWSGRDQDRTASERDRRDGVRVALSDAGSASLEFITVGLVLLVPLVYLVVTMSALQGAAFATEGAASQAARVYVQADDDEDAADAAARAVQFALDDYGLDAADATTTVSCRPEPRECLTRRGTVTVTVEYAVTLPLVPPTLDLALPLSVPVAASATQTVSRFWSPRP
jgi:Na+-transporting methylmalonyl-CoA/oxaloacetate decarboxylase gamma subunit